MMENIGRGLTELMYTLAVLGILVGIAITLVTTLIVSKKEYKVEEKLEPIRIELVVKETNRIDTLYVYTKKQLKGKE